MTLRNSIAALILSLSLWSAAWADPVVLQSGDDSCNCHGYTFTAGNRVVDQFGGSESAPDNVGQVIQDGYQPVTDPSTARPGDIIVYDGADAPSHTGIVVGVKDGRPVVVSKWGQQGDLKLHDPGEYGKARDADWRIYRKTGSQADPENERLSRELLEAGDERAVRRAADRLLPRLQRLNMARNIRLSDVPGIERSTSFRNPIGTEPEQQFLVDRPVLRLPHHSDAPCR
jgi:hypothetical protein